MNRDRRRFVTTTATLAAAQLAGIGIAEAQSPRDGKEPITGSVIDTLADFYRAQADLEAALGVRAKPSRP